MNVMGFYRTRFFVIILTLSQCVFWYYDQYGKSYQRFLRSV